MTDETIPEAAERTGDLRAAIQSVGLPGDAPWSQVVTALRGAGLADVLPSSSSPTLSPEDGDAAASDAVTVPSMAGEEGDSTPPSGAQDAAAGHLATLRAKLHDAVDEFVDDLVRPLEERQAQR